MAVVIHHLQCIHLWRPFLRISAGCLLVSSDGILEWPHNQENNFGWERTPSVLQTSEVLPAFRFATYFGQEGLYSTAKHLGHVLQANATWGYMRACVYVFVCIRSWLVPFDKDEHRPSIIMPSATYWALARYLRSIYAMNCRSGGCHYYCDRQNLSMGFKTVEGGLSAPGHPHWCVSFDVCLGIF